MRTIKCFFVVAIWMWKNRHWNNTRQKRKALERVKLKAMNERF